MDHIGLFENYLDEITIIYLDSDESKVLQYFGNLILFMICFDYAL